MNNERRKCIKSSIEHLNLAIELLQFCTIEEEQAYNNLPENVQVKERGYVMQNNISILTTAYKTIEDIIGSLSTIE